jgi:hypothetical protein
MVLLLVFLLVFLIVVRVVEAVVGRAGRERGLEELAGGAVLEDRLLGAGPEGGVEVEARVGGEDLVDRVRVRLGLGRRGPVDGGVEGAVEPGDVRVFEPASNSQH